ncbi:MAG: OmpH family outer membrane protein [Muribaculaceae bacterium]|nr:OmpH family outer membrane protein [Muribaculaceae bacterium]
MFKKILLAVLVALPMSAMAQKFGVVNLETLFTSLPAYSAMENEVNASSKQYEETTQKLMDEVNNLVAEYQKIENDPSVQNSIKELRRQEIEDKYRKVETFRNNAIQELQNLRATRMAPIEKTVTEAIKAVGAEGGYTMILPNEPALLLYTGSDVIDLTETIKARLPKE